MSWSDLGEKQPKYPCVRVIKVAGAMNSLFLSFKPPVRWFFFKIFLGGFLWNKKQKEKKSWMRNTRQGALFLI
jgi:hypothetical protein